MNRHLANLSNEGYEHFMLGFRELLAKTGIGGSGPGYDLYQALDDQRALAIVHVVLGPDQDLQKSQGKA